METVKLHFARPVEGRKLSRELLKAAPALADVTGLVEWNDDECWVNVPPGVDQSVVAGVVQQHDATPDPPPPGAKHQRDALLDSIDPSKPAAAIAKLVAVLKALPD